MTPQALLENGQIKVLFGGRMMPVSQNQCWQFWHYAREVERNQPKADEIHAVLEQSGYYK
jgi:hypothetical protein